MQPTEGRLGADLADPHGRGGRRRRVRLRTLVHAAPYLVRTQPWGPLAGIAGLGIVICAAMASFAGPFQGPQSLVEGLRAALVVTSLGVAFVFSDPAPDLLEALPAPSRMLHGLRLGLALPLVAVAALGQLMITGHAFVVDERLQGLRPRLLPWSGLVVELVGFCGLCVLAGALVGRSRWADLDGALASVFGLGLIAMLGLAPFGLLPTSYLLDATRGHRAAWVVAEWSWTATAAASIVIATWSSRDRWQRLHRRGYR
ncbi:MAG: hypothetical protein ACYDGN_12380 [Acidimicrobiales bacterium]